MKVDACNSGTQSTIKVKGAGTEVSGDSFSVFLQMLLGGILNNATAVPQAVNPSAGNGLQDGKAGETYTGSLTGMPGVITSDLTNNASDVLSMLKQLRQAEGGFTGAGINDAQNSLADSNDAKSGAAAAGTEGGKVSSAITSAGQAQGYIQNLPKALLKAIEAVSDAKDAKTTLSSIDLKGTNIKGVQDGGNGTPVEKTILDGQAPNIKSAGIVLKSGSAADVSDISKTSTNGVAKNIEEMKTVFSGGHDEGTFSSKDGNSQKAVKEDTLSSSDEKAVQKNDQQVFQNTVVLKPVSDQTGPGQTEQTGIDKQSPVVNKEDILNQVYDKIKVLDSNGTSELHVNLKPDQLGDVSIKLVMEKGAINARITVENSSVKNIMETSMSQIKEHLKEQNVNVSHLTVYVGTGQKEQGSSGGFQQYRWKHAKKIQPQENVSGVNIQESQYYGGVLNLLA